MGNACVAVVQYGPMEELPPVMTLLSSLRRLGHPVYYIGLESSAGREFLKRNDIPFTFLLQRRKSRLFRILTFLPRRLQLLRLLKRLKQKHGAVVPWFQECCSAALAGDGVYRIGPCVTTFFEYECNYGRRWIGFDFNRMMNSNVIVECEINRARMTQRNHKLKDCPLVVANKAELDFSKIPGLNDEAKSVFGRIGDRPVFLYQGCISGDREDVPFVLETIAKNRPQYCVLVLPGTPEVVERLSPYANAFTLSRIPAPGHLAVTAKATVGIAMYKSTGTGVWDLNAQYCAPNKIYEYAAFGLPTLGNKIPGLESTIGTSHAGVLCDIDEEQILSAADDLVARIGYYREQAISFYKNTDVVRQVRAVLEARLAS